MKFLLALLGVFLAVIVGLYGAQAYRDMHPQLYINFTQYEPTKVFDNLSIQSKGLEVWSPNESLWFIVSQSIIDLNFNHDYVSVREFQNKKNVIYDNMCSATNIKCFDAISPKGQKYTLQRTYDTSNKTQTGRLIYERIVFVRGGTRIQINVDSQNNAPIPGEDWNNMIDSFQPTTFQGFTVKHMYPGP